MGSGDIMHTCFDVGCAARGHIPLIPLGTGSPSYPGGTAIWPNPPLPMSPVQPGSYWTYEALAGLMEAVRAQERAIVLSELAELQRASEETSA